MNLLYAVPAAIGLGALHSLEPGHGKGVMTAYLISSRAKLRDAILLGIISSIAHTLSIAALSFAASSTVTMFVPEQLSHWIELAAGIIITFIGGKLLLEQINPRVIVVGRIGHHRVHQETCEHHHHTSTHSRVHSHAHMLQQTPDSIERLFVIGFFAGLIPCPSAVAIFLVSVSAHEIPIGLTLVIAFSIGSALAMSTVAVLVARAGQSIRLLERRKVIQTFGALSSFLILSLGSFVILQSLRHLTLL